MPASTQTFHLFTRGLAALVFVFSATLVRAAGPLPGAGSYPVDRGQAVHGWAVLRVEENDIEAVLLHLPPRTAPTGAAEARQAQDGSVRPANYLATVPEFIAARGNETLLVFPPASDGRGNRLRRVASLTAVPAPIGGLWISNPDGRFLALPPLTGEGELLGLVGTPIGYLALLEVGSDEGPTLYRLAADAWRPFPLPRGDGPSVTAGAAPRLIALPDGFAIALPRAERPGMWIGRVGSSATGQEGGPIDWAWRDIEAAALPVSSGPLVFVRGQFVYAVRAADGSLDLWTVGETAPLRLATIEGVDGSFALVPLEDAGRVAVLWTQQTVGPASPSAGGAAAKETIRRRHHIAEVSVLTGRILYNGPTRPESPVSPRDFQLLAVLLAGVMLVIVLFVLKPERGSEEFSLPQGFALAEPGRRVSAGLLDAAPALLLAIRLNDANPADLFTMSGLLGEGNGLWTIMTMLGLGFAHTTIGEWLLGRSIGKALVGCEVVAVRQSRSPDGTLRPIIARPRLWQVVVRNLVRWAVPPLAFEGLSNPGRRHRGDTLAGTVVVIRIENEPADDAEA